MIESPYFPYAFALLIAVPFLVYVRQFVYNYLKFKKQEISLLSVKGQSAQRIQAYERMILFLDRIKPAQLIRRFGEDLAVHEFVYLTEKVVAQEFDYNAAQQLYLSKKSWESVVASKENMLHLLHSTYDTLNENSTLQEYKTVLLMKYMEGEDYLAAAIHFLRKENMIVN